MNVNVSGAINAKREKKYNYLHKGYSYIGG